MSMPESLKVKHLLEVRDLWTAKASEYWAKAENLKLKMKLLKEENKKLKARLAELEGNK